MIMPTCVALLALLQASPEKKDQFPVEQRRECAIQGMVSKIQEACWGQGIDTSFQIPPGACKNPLPYATDVIDEIIRLKTGKTP